MLRQLFALAAWATFGLICFGDIVTDRTFDLRQARSALSALPLML